MCLSFSGKELEEVYQKLQMYDGSSPLLVSQFEGALSTLLEDVKHVLADNEKLKHMFTKLVAIVKYIRVRVTEVSWNVIFALNFREKEKHREQMQGLEEELEAHVAKVEEQVREQARKKYEIEKREMTEKMTAEMVELETQLKLFQKVKSFQRRSR